MNDDISKPTNDAYREGWERTFGKRDGAPLCVCGHPAGHHDDEPDGCWDCDCEAFSSGAGNG